MFIKQAVGDFNSSLAVSTYFFIFFGHSVFPGLLRRPPLSTNRSVFLSRAQKENGVDSSSHFSRSALLWVKNYTYSHKIISLATIICPRQHFCRFS